MRFHAFWVSPGIGFAHIGFPVKELGCATSQMCEVSSELALPALGFLCFGFPYKFSLIVVRPGFGFHTFRLSRGLGFDGFGFLL